MNSRKLAGTTFAGLAVSSFLVGGDALATPYSVLLESNADRTSNEIYLANYASEIDLLASSSAYSALNVSSAFVISAFGRSWPIAPEDF